MEVSLLYCSIACNRTPHAVSWHQTGTLAFAADKSIALAEAKKEDNPDVLNVITTLHGHTERVNCVQWINYRGCGHIVAEQPRELVSGSVDKSIHVWRENESNEFCCVDILRSHSEPVICIAATYTETGACLFSSSSDSSVIIWNKSIKEDQFTAYQTISFGRGFIFGIDCYFLPASDIILLTCGGDDGKVHLFIQQNDKYEKVLSLIGHDDWIRDIHIIQEDNGDLLLASCSQDTYIRLWRLCQEKTTPTLTGCSEVGELRLQGNRFQVLDKMEHVVTLEAVLYGHDDWVYSCQWCPLHETPSGHTQPLCLLSASMDKTMILWKPDTSGVWLEQVRVGEVGGNTLGLYGGIFGPRGDTILAHGYQGAFHIWKKRTMSTSEDSERIELWQPLVAPSGHFGPVQDLCWEPKKGSYLLSVSSDQSTRLHAPWVIPNGKTSWHELARPQIHGYDLQCIALFSTFHFISGADEKALRVFEAPKNFVENLSRVSKTNIQVSETLPLGASVPALGLSNKAIFTNEELSHVELESEDSTNILLKDSFSSQVPIFTPIDLSEPPIEEHLLQNTLWPETQKLYGHGYELYCVATNGYLVASACKASSLEHAAIRVWDTKSWHQVAVLTCHALTVTQLAFSHCGTMLLAVSRDRCWSLWQQSSDQSKEIFSCIAQMDKKTKTHARIIWTCSWSHDDRYFATGSRDKKICVWSKYSSFLSATDCGNGWRLVNTPLDLPQPVTALDFAPRMMSCDRYLLAMGLENGEIIFTNFMADKGVWSPLMTIHPFLNHTSTVRRIQWQPLPDKSAHSRLLLASCSHDQSVRILVLKITDFS